MATADGVDDGIEILSEVLYDADGNVTKDTKKAVSGNVTMRLANGEVVHSRLVSDQLKKSS